MDSLVFRQQILLLRATVRLAITENQYNRLKLLNKINSFIKILLLVLLTMQKSVSQVIFNIFKAWHHQMRV